jgi:hypothetical protein
VKKETKLWPTERIMRECERAFPTKEKETKMVEARRSKVKLTSEEWGVVLGLLKRTDPVTVMGLSVTLLEDYESPDKEIRTQMIKLTVDATITAMQQHALKKLKEERKL